MGPRLGLLILLLPVGCAPAPSEEAASLAAALDASRGALAAVSPGGLLPASPMPAPARAAPRPTMAATPARPRTFEDAPGTRPLAAAQLLGAAPEALRRWLGEPVLRRPEGPAEIWLYAGQDCALDLVLYREGGQLRVAHAAARANGAAAQTEGACLRQISAAAAGRPVPAASETTPVARREPGA